MKRNCENCMNISSYGMGAVNCKKRGKIYVQDPFEFTSNETDCEHFEPEIIYLNYKGVERESYLTLVENLKKSPLIGSSIRNFVNVPSDSHMSTGRGMAMLMLSDNDLPIFEGDSEYKNYSGGNHMFADLLVPISSKVKNPIIFWLAKNNPPGSKYHCVTSPIIHHVIQLGDSYSLEEVISSLAEALRYEKVQVISPWFFRKIERIAHKNIHDISPVCREVFFEIEPHIRESLLKKRRELRTGTINWVIYSDRCPSLRVVAETLGFDEYIVGSTDARKTILYCKGILEGEKELPFSKFIAEEMTPLSSWLLFDIDDTYWGAHWIPLLKHLKETPSKEKGIVVFIKEGLINKNPFSDFVDKERQKIVYL